MEGHQGPPEVLQGAPRALETTEKERHQIHLNVEELRF